VPGEIYNPLDKRNLADSVASALLREPVSALPLENMFPGAGIYAIYYSGSFREYEPIAVKNQKGRYKCPIYVGKAIPGGSRKGAGTSNTQGNWLYRRINEHAESIERAINLELADFRCRYLVVDDIWIPLGESLLIERFQPLWNVFIDGFGNHDPGEGRYKQRRSAWDTLHPGRPWAVKCLRNDRADNEILEAVVGFLT